MTPDENEEFDNLNSNVSGAIEEYREKKCKLFTMKRIWPKSQIPTKICGAAAGSGKTPTGLSICADRQPREEGSQHTCPPGESRYARAVETAALGDVGAVRNQGRTWAFKRERRCTLAARSTVSAASLFTRGLLREIRAGLDIV